jgi:Cu/Ag efflux protein CusF
MRSKFPLAVLSAAFLAVAAPAWAQSVKGTVTKVDPAAGKVTLDHAAIPKLDMDAMTMAYRVKDPAMLKDLKTGDKVDFDVAETDGGYTVTKIQKAK